MTPGSWETVSLGELCDIALGKTPGRKTAAYWDTEKKTDNVWLSIADIPEAEGSCPVLSESKEHVSDVGAALCKPVKAGTLMVSFKLTLGRMAIAGKDILTNEAIAALPIKDEDQIDRDYLYWYFTYFDWQDAAKNDHKIKGKTLNKSKLKLLPVILPPLSEQRRIVSVLDTAFAGLANAEANTRQNLTNARELFESERDAILSKDGSKWHESALEDIAGEVKTGPFGSLLHKSDYVDGGIPLVNPINIVGDQIQPDFRKAVSENTLDRLSAYRLEVGDVVIGRRGEIGRCAVINEEQSGWLCGTGCFFIRPGAKMNGEFLCHLLRSDTYRSRLEAEAGRATMPSISNKQLAKLSIRAPEFDVQVKAVERINAAHQLSADIAEVQNRKLAALAALKQSLLHRAFRGELSANEEMPGDGPYLFPSIGPRLTSTELYAGVVAYAYQYHVDADEQAKFGHVKAEKTVHLAEAHLKFDLGRQPVRNAAGPDDTRRRLEVEAFAREHDYYDFRKSDSGRGYALYPLSKFEEIKTRMTDAIGEKINELEVLVDWLTPMRKRQVEIVATLYAAWNNLLFEGIANPSNERIVKAARDDWHRDKLNILPGDFFEGLRDLREEGMMPRGDGHYVGLKGRG